MAPNSMWEAFVIVDPHPLCCIVLHLAHESYDASLLLTSVGLLAGYSTPRLSTAHFYRSQASAFLREILYLDSPLMARNRLPLYYTNGRLLLHCSHIAMRRPTLFCTQRGIGFPCPTTIFCTKRLTFNMPLKPNAHLRMLIA